MKTWTVLTKEIYQELLNDTKIHPDPLAEYYSTEGMVWILQQYEHTVNVQTRGLFNGFNFKDTPIESLAEGYFADKEWVLLELDIPDKECMVLNVMSEYCIPSTYPAFFNEVDTDAFDQYWSDKFKEKGFNIFHADSPLNDDFFSDAEALRRTHICDIAHSWSILLKQEKDEDYDESWCGPFELIPYTHVIKAAWIVSAVEFQGREWDKWIGPNKINANEYPLLEGYGDTLKIGDHFMCDQITDPGDIMQLVGWETEHLKWDNELMYTIYAISSRGDNISFALNPQGGDRHVTKVEVI